MKINKHESPQAYRILNSPPFGIVSNEFKEAIFALAKLEKEFSALKAKTVAYARIRDILAFNEQGFAVMDYDIDLDEPVWRIGYGSFKFVKHEQTKESGGYVICDANIVRGKSA